MMFLAVFLSCAPTQKINNSKQPWNFHDDELLKSAQKRCKILYKNSPCLSKFIKVEFREIDPPYEKEISYHAYCKGVK